MSLEPVTTLDFTTFQTTYVSRTCDHTGLPNVSHLRYEKWSHVQSAPVDSSYLEENFMLLQVQQYRTRMQPLYLSTFTQHNVGFSMS